MKASLKKTIRSLIVMALATPMIAHAHGPLRDAMTDMYDSMKTITNALIKGQATSDAELKTASNDLLASAVKASKLLPTELAGADGKARPGKEKEVAVYNDLMTKLLAALTELDQDIKAGKKDAAKTLLQATIAPLQKQGHDLFKHEH